MCVGDENVIRFSHMVDSQHFGQDIWSLKPCVQEDDEAVGFHAKRGGTCMINEPHESRLGSQETLNVVATYRTTRLLHPCCEVVAGQHGGVANEASYSSH